jgi:hypothetical protein
MYRDLAPDRSLGTNEYSSICRERPSTGLRSVRLASETADEKAESIMLRLVREYMEQPTPIGS